MPYYAEPIARLLEELERLPGIGPKSAQRLAFHILKGDDETARRLSDSIVEVKRLIHFCAVCFNFAAEDLCEYCADGQRDRTAICVVEEPRDVVAIERTGEFRGLYHVLQGPLPALHRLCPRHRQGRQLPAPPHE